MRLANKIILTGKGLHSGKDCKLVIEPYDTPVILMNNFPITKFSLNGTNRGSDYIFPLIFIFWHFFINQELETKRQKIFLLLNPNSSAWLRLSFRAILTFLTSKADPQPIQERVSLRYADELGNPKSKRRQECRSLLPSVPPKSLPCRL